MPLQTKFHPNIEEKLSRLFKKDRQRYEILMKKVKQISMSDEQTIDHYKNLRNDQSDRKRVHVDKSFVLTFSYNRETKTIEFLDFDHHDNIYER